MDHASAVLTEDPIGGANIGSPHRVCCLPRISPSARRVALTPGRRVGRSPQLGSRLTVLTVVLLSIFIVPTSSGLLQTLVSNVRQALRGVPQRMTVSISSLARLDLGAMMFPPAAFVGHSI